jgi:hypothetical protein
MPVARVRSAPSSLPFLYVVFLPFATRLSKSHKPHSGRSGCCHRLGSMSSIRKGSTAVHPVSCGNRQQWVDCRIRSDGADDAAGHLQDLAVSHLVDPSRQYICPISPDRRRASYQQFCQPAHSSKPRYVVLFRHHVTRPCPAEELLLRDEQAVGLQEDEKQIEARVPSSTGTPSASNCRRRSCIRKRPNSRAASAVAELDRLAPCSNGFLRPSTGFGSVFVFIAGHRFGCGDL